MTSRYRVEWDLIVTAENEADYQAAVAKLQADAAMRLDLLGEQWNINEYPLTKTVRAQLITHVDDLDAAA